MGVAGAEPPPDSSRARAWKTMGWGTRGHTASPGVAHGKNPALGLRALGSLKVPLPVAKHARPAGEGGSGEVLQQPG